MAAAISRTAYPFLVADEWSLLQGNVLDKQYLEKLRKEEVSIDWAHRVLISSIRQQRMLKMMAIADDRHFNYDSENDLVQFITSEIQKEGLDLINDDSYPNTSILSKNICNILYLVDDWSQRMRMADLVVF